MPTLRQSRRLKAHASARQQKAQAYSEHMHALHALEDEFDDWDGDDGPGRDLTCRHCDGTGGDRWNDGITPCEHCDGEGYEWWQ
jgi:hypothetical protein